MICKKRNGKNGAKRKTSKRKMMMVMKKKEKNANTNDNDNVNKTKKNNKPSRFFITKYCRYAWK